MFGARVRTRPSPNPNALLTRRRRSRWSAGERHMGADPDTERQVLAVEVELKPPGVVEHVPAAVAVLAFGHRIERRQAVVEVLTPRDLTVGAVMGVIVRAVERQIVGERAVAVEVAPVHAP